MFDPRSVKTDHNEANGIGGDVKTDARLSARDAIILDCYVLAGGCGRALAAELKCSLQYIYFRASVLKKRFGITAKRAGVYGNPHRRAVVGDAVCKFGRARKLDSALVKELFNEGATEWEIARLFDTSKPAVVAALKGAT